MKKKQIIGLVIAVVLFILTGVASVFTHAISESLLSSDGIGTVFFAGELSDDIEDEMPLEDYIAVVDVVGTIQEESTDALSESEYLHDDTLMYIDELMEDEANKGILLYVDSPGGTVYESEELYLKLKEYKEKTGNKIWAYMAHYAASGGYMVSMAADKIYANPNTTTGSIGVIMSGYDLTGLYKKLGIEYYSITSGEYKDSSKMTEEQMDIYQEQVNECYEKFVDIVEAGRTMSEADVKKVADGRTYTANQALKLGLIDEIALYDDMEEAMRTEFGVDEIYYQELVNDEFDWKSLFLKAKELIPKSEAQILKETAAEMESGVLMYYAEH